MYEVLIFSRDRFFFFVLTFYLCVRSIETGSVWLGKANLCCICSFLYILPFVLSFLVHTSLVTIGRHYFHHPLRYLD
jgi:hypothetical protein